MKPDRHLTWEEKRASLKRAKEEKLCRYCGLDVKRLSTRRSTFCSPECVHEFLIRSDSGYIREQVYKRDKGICTHCGLNCSTFFATFKRYIQQIPYSKRAEEAELYFQSKGVPFYKSWRNRRTFWDIDHILPVEKGGGQCGMENLQLLCVNCHLKKTIEERRKHETTDTVVDIGAEQLPATELLSPETLCEPENLPKVR